ncbi:MAG TPA: sigma-70 family RNA polymerase sigma factor [Gemmatimonadales bacterium]|nr:sigma-70 family RNA polymerase sigma factor [Gemmatimonadales bacterium]
MLPHLGEAYSLARYLTRNDHDAEDVVQDAYLRAFTYRETFRGEGSQSARAWFLTIVRNTAFSWKRKSGNRVEVAEFDETHHSEAVAGNHPEAAMLRTAEREALADAIEQLPTEFREVIVLREVEGLSYREISEVVGVPAGTVMSRLSRARERLQRALLPVRGD